MLTSDWSGNHGCNGLGMVNDGWFVRLDDSSCLFTSGNQWDMLLAIFTPLLTVMVHSGNANSGWLVLVVGIVVDFGQIHIMRRDIK